MLLYFVTAWGKITGLVAYNECPSQALNWGLQKKSFMSFVSLYFQTV